jgi:hypothetical protein
MMYIFSRQGNLDTRACHHYGEIDFPFGWLSIKGGYYAEYNCTSILSVLQESKII